MAAAAFYNAARQEILERVRFRDQVVISVIAGLFVFVGTYGSFLFGPVASLKVSTINDITAYSVSLLFVSLLVWAGVTFVTRYSGYQNSKIAELGYFISAVPALHLQEYGHQELNASAIEVSPSAAKISNEFTPAQRDLLLKTLGHWDRWARKLEEEPELKLLRGEFSQDQILLWLFMSLSFLPTVLLILFLLKFSMIFGETDIATTTASVVTNWIIVSAVGAIACLCPWFTKRIYARAAMFKDIYKKMRDDVPLR